MMKYSLLICVLLIAFASCQRAEQILVEVGQPFSFDCKLDESIYFGRRIGQWSDIRENADQYASLNFKYNTLKKENIIRVTTDSAQSQHVGYYACRKPTWSTSSMSRVYQLLIADVESFYWTYTCHAALGSCERTDDPDDETTSVFQVADQSDVDLYCCAVVTGYKNVNIKMNQIGESQGRIDVKRKQELDGSWVVCATQHTRFTRKSYQNQALFTCELITDDRSYSTLSTAIIMKNAVDVDSGEVPSSGYTTPSEGGTDYFNRQRPSNRGKLSTRKKLAIILGSVFGGLLLLGLIIVLLICCLCRKNKAPKTPNIPNAPAYSKVPTSTRPKLPPIPPPRPKNVRLPEHAYTYLDPTPLYQNAPVKFRV